MRGIRWVVKRKEKTKKMQRETNTTEVKMVKVQILEDGIWGCWLQGDMMEYLMEIILVG